MLVYPTIDLPPASFGTRDNPYSDLLVDTVTSSPGTATIILAYFTRAGDELKFTGDKTKPVHIDGTPFR